MPTLHQKVKNASFFLAAPRLRPRLHRFNDRLRLADSSLFQLLALTISPLSQTSRTPLRRMQRLKLRQIHYSHGDSNRNAAAVADPIDPMTIAAARARTYPGSAVTIEQKLEPGANYDRYIASYMSDGLKIMGC